MFISVLSTFYKFLPEIRLPKTALSLKERLLWTLVALILYFFMYHTTVFGIKVQQSGFNFVQMITASRYGSLLTLGIGPIVISSILLQLLSGAGFFKLNVYNPVERKKFSEVQIVVAILIAMFQALLFANSTVGLSGNGPLVDPHFSSNNAIFYLVALQIFLGAVIIIYLDQLITRYGIGSGISWFIAAGVSYSIISHFIALLFGPTGIVNIFSENPGIEALQQAIITLIPVIMTYIVFRVIVYLEGYKITLPLTFGFGVTRNVQLPFFYLSNIPVIFAAAFLMAVYFFSMSLISYEGTGLFADMVRWLGGVLYLLTPLRPGLNIISYMNLLIAGKTPILGLPEWVHAITYVISMAAFSVMFGSMWAEMSNMDASSFAKMIIENRGAIPGFRRDPRLIRKKIEENITPLIYLSSLAVGLVAAIADLTGALGTGTGILLTVTIFDRMYPQLKEGLRLYFPKLAKVLE